MNIIGDNIMKSIVTGGAGFIGSHIVDRLIEMGHEVIVIDNESSQSHEQFYRNENALYYQYDIAEYDLIRPLFDDVDYVFHLAAESRIQPAIENPLLCVRTNVTGTATVLQCAREANVKKVIYSSTSSAYGRKNEPPLDETMPEDCLNPYSVAKVAGEKLCKMYNDLFGLETITFRYFNVYGKREPTKGQYAPVVGLFLRQKKAQQPLTIVGDGLQRRDFTHVSDVVDANIKAMGPIPSILSGTVFNIGTGVNHSVLELAEMISDSIEFIPPRIGESRVTLADTTKSSTVLKWAPQRKLEDYIQAQINE
jgi:UDP-glucose 4-epimerase